MSIFINLSSNKEQTLNSNFAKKTDNESEIFEYNNLFIEGFNFKCKISEILDEFSNLNEGVIQEPISVSDLYEKTIEEEIEELIKNEREKILKKKIFNLHKDQSKEPTHNHLRNEAKVVEESIKKVKTKSYENVLEEKFKDCQLLSNYFYKHYYDKKEIGRENNYIFNFADNFLNDMTSIDKNFFLDYFTKINPYSLELFKLTEQEQNDDSRSNLNSNSKEGGNLIYLNKKPKIILFENKPQEHISKKDTIFPNKSLELIYNFAVYHPLKNTKSQQIEVLGSSTLSQLRDKIYCVIDEIDDHYNKTINNSFMNEDNLRKFGSFFFIENNFYNDLRKTNLNLSSKIARAKHEKDQYMTQTKDNYYTKRFDNISTNENISPYGDVKNIFNHYNHSNYCFDHQLFVKNTYQEIRMDSTRIDHIVIRIGYPYLFRHQEYCDHMIMLTDIRILDIYDYNSFVTEESNLEKSIVTYQKKLKRRLCDFCGFFYSK